jgi:hypothetical protein
MDFDNQLCPLRFSKYLAKLLIFFPLMWHIFKQIVHQLATLFAIKLFSPNQVTQYFFTIKHTLYPKPFSTENHNILTYFEPMNLFTLHSYKKIFLQLHRLNQRTETSPKYHPGKIPGKFFQSLGTIILQQKYFFQPFGRTLQV